MEEIDRNKMMTIPVSSEEMDVAKREADRLGMSVSAFIRLLIKNWTDGIRFEKKSNGTVV